MNDAGELGLWIDGIARALRGGAMSIALCALIGCSADPHQQRGGTGGAALMGSAGAAAGKSAAGGTSGNPDAGTNFGNRDGAVPPPPDAGMIGAGGSAMKMECAAVSQAAEVKRQPADIIVGIDTSGSMEEEIGFVQQNMNAFSQQIISSGIDVHVILVAAEKPVGSNTRGVCIAAPLGSGSCPLDSNPPVYTHINQKVGSHDVLEVFINSYPSYRSLLREEALKTFVSVTDDDANGAIGTADAFISAVQGLEQQNSKFWSNYRYSSIYSFTECEQAAAIGTVHAELVTKTKGVAGDLCLQDFKPVFDALAVQVVAGAKLACDWAIPPPPKGENFDAKKTNVQLTLDGTTLPIGKAAEMAECTDREAWHYDDENAPTRVVACPASCTKIQAAKQASVDILFGCETHVVPPPG